MTGPGRRLGFVGTTERDLARLARGGRAASRRTWVVMGALLSLSVSLVIAEETSPPPPSAEPTPPAAPAPPAAAPAPPTSPPAGAQAATADRCAALALHGYTVGMPFDAAEKLQPLKENKGLTRFSGGSMRVYVTRDKVDGEEGALIFDKDKRLRSWNIHLDAERFAQMDKDLRAKFGEPTVEERPDRAADPNAPVSRTIWRSSPCDVQIQLAVYASKVGPVRSIGLERLSTVPRSSPRAPH